MCKTQKKEKKKQLEWKTELFYDVYSSVHVKSDRCKKKILINI